MIFYLAHGTFKNPGPGVIIKTLARLVAKPLQVRTAECCGRSYRTGVFSCCTRTVLKYLITANQQTLPFPTYFMKYANAPMSYMHLCVWTWSHREDTTPTQVKSQPQSPRAQEARITHEKLQLEVGVRQDDQLHIMDIDKTR